MGFATERIFLPLIKTTAPDVTDYAMPENGVFHNLILAKIDTLYPGHAKQTMHAFWGVGQMSFVKHAVFFPKDAPNLRDYPKIVDYIANRFDITNLLVSEGVLDALDHSSNDFAYGGKLGIDLTETKIKTETFGQIEETKLNELLSEAIDGVRETKIYLEDTPNKTICIKLERSQSADEIFKNISQFSRYGKIFVLFDNKNNDLDNPYMLFWRLLNNIDAKRDIFVYNNVILIDATAKTEKDGYARGWPKDTVCDKNVIGLLKEKEIIECDDSFLRKWQIVDLD